MEAMARGDVHQMEQGDVGVTAPWHSRHRCRPCLTSARRGVLLLLSSDLWTISLPPYGAARPESASLQDLVDLLEVGGSIPSPPTKPLPC
jgi:hypothetical protein